MARRTRAAEIDVDLTHPDADDVASEEESTEPTYSVEALERIAVRLGKENEILRQVLIAAKPFDEVYVNAKAQRGSALQRGQTAVFSMGTLEVLSDACAEASAVLTATADAAAALAALDIPGA